MGGSLSGTPGNRSQRWLWILVMAAVLNQVTVHLVRPTTTYKLIELGADSFMVGAVTAGYAVLPLILALYLGGLAQRLPSLKPLLVGGAVLTTLGAAAVSWAESFATILAASALMGMGQLIFTIGGQSAVARFASNSQLDMSFGWFTAGFAAGQMIGPLLGGILLSGGPVGAPADPQLGLSMPDINQALWVGTAISVPAILLLQFSGKRYRRQTQLQKSQAGSQDQPQDTSRASAAEILKRPGILSHLVASMALVATMDVLTAFLPLVANEAGVSPFWVGLLLALRAGMTILSRTMLSFLRRHFSREVLVLASLLVTGAALFVPPLALHHLWLAFLTLGVAGFFAGLGQPLTMSLVTQSVPDHWRSSALAVRLTGNRLGVVVIPLAAGAVAAPIGPAGAIWFTCLLLGASGTEKALQAVRGRG
ncbi:MFS transporter [Nesterenkonia ebinurensis]|uniref:MFS transporter n=1 Tax=Nesterenkonia ebinurensis TaxID=2608252 RepID=UPI00123E1B49|nr:MFS transporter [Nesterenkonia ebinurensis]